MIGSDFRADFEGWVLANENPSKDEEKSERLKIFCLLRMKVASPTLLRPISN